MKPQDFLKELHRLCSSYYAKECTDCPLKGIPCNGDLNEMHGDDEFGRLYDAVAKWSDEHPVKTRQSEFLKHYPDAMIAGDGILTIKPCQLDEKLMKDRAICDMFGCNICCRKYWIEQIKSEESK